MRYLFTLSLILVISYESSAQANFIDPTFGNNGTVLHDFCGKSYTRGGIQQPDGKIILFGFADETSAILENFAIARYSEDGILDSSFSIDGIDTIDINQYLDEANDAVIDRHGRILLAGDSHDLFNNFLIGLVRYESNGSRDATFGTQGQCSHEINSSFTDANALAIDSMDRILVAGQMLTNSYDGFLVRMLMNGSIDSTFGINGVVTEAEPGWQGAYDLLVQPDGKYLVSGYSDPASGTPAGLALKRYLDNGGRDSSFNGTGTMNDTSFSISSNKILLQPDGKIVVIGSCSHQPYHHAALIRYNTDGTRDSTFGVYGFTEIFSNGNGMISSAALLSDGSILGAGYYPGTNYSITLFHFLANGSLDSLFGVNGIVQNLIGPLTNSLVSVLPQSSGKIVLAAWSAIYSTSLDVDFSMIRYGTNVYTETAEYADKNQGITVFPNPVTDACTVQFSRQFASGSTFRLWDATGRLVETYVVSGSRIKIPMEHFAPGLYYVTVSDLFSGELAGEAILKN